jgi:pimeloyl-ACP methyl ester carboxylesterase
MINRPVDTREIDHQRRRLLGVAGMSIAAAQFGMARFASAQSSVPKPPGTSREPATNASFAPLKQINAGVLSVGYAEIGSVDRPAVILLHGWPYDIHSYLDVAPLLASAGYRVIVPYFRGYGTTRFLSGETVRNGQQAALAADTIALMDALGIQKAIVAGYDWGARTADIVAALWPERCKALVSVSGYLIGSREANKVPLPPKAELAWWYQFYFATERGRAGYEMYRKEMARLIWQTASPKWAFDDATFDRSAQAFDNPDHVGIVIHNYRWRIGLADGEPIYDAWEKRLAEAPVIRVPTITLEGDANGAPHPDPASYAKQFSGRYTHRLITGGVGHNLPQEAPKAFADAVIEVDGY